MGLAALQTVCGQAENGQIVALRRPAGEQDLAAGCANHLCHPVAGLLHGSSCAKAIVVRPASGIPEFFDEVLEDIFLHARIDRRRRGTVEIDGHLSSIRRTALRTSGG